MGPGNKRRNNSLAVVFAQAWDIQLPMITNGSLPQAMAARPG